jgi:hypothetical protein
MHPSFLGIKSRGLEVESSIDSANQVLILPIECLILPIKCWILPIKCLILPLNDAHELCGIRILALLNLKNLAFEMKYSSLV